MNNNSQARDRGIRGKIGQKDAWKIPYYKQRVLNWKMPILPKWGKKKNTGKKDSIGPKDQTIEDELWTFFTKDAEFSKELDVI